MSASAPGVIAPISPALLKARAPFIVAIRKISSLDKSPDKDAKARISANRLSSIVWPRLFFTVAMLSVPRQRFTLARASSSRGKH